MITLGHIRNAFQQVAPTADADQYMAQFVKEHGSEDMTIEEIDTTFQCLNTYFRKEHQEHVLDKPTRKVILKELKQFI